MGGRTKTQPALGIFLWRALRWFEDGIREKLRERGMFATTRTQMQVMGSLSMGETRPARLARTFGISPQAMSLVLDTLIEAGLVEIWQDTTDKRARVMHLTELGEQYLSIQRSIAHELESILEARFGRAVIDVVRMVFEADWDPIPSAATTEIEQNQAPKLTPK